MADGQLVERLRQYLGELPPEARTLLTAELERAVLRGEDMPGLDIVLRELRHGSREPARAKRPGNLARLFFQPLEPFLVDDIASRRHPGRIARATLDPIWAWIGRDLIAGEAKAVTEQVSAAFERGDAARAEALASAFQDRAVARIEEVVSAAAKDERAHRRLSGQIGTQHGIDDVAVIAAVLKAREPLSKFSARLPGLIENFEEGMVGDVKALIDSTQIRGQNLFHYKLVMVMGRLGASWQLIRLATRAAGSDNTARICETPYGVAVDIVLAEIERMIGELKAELRTGRGLATSPLLKNIHDAIRGTRSEIDLEHDSPWSRRLAALRTQVSDVVKGEIESLNGRVRRLIRPRPITEIAPNSVVDPNDLQDTEALIEFVGACRHYANELAVNELTARTWTELELYLDTTAAILVENLRNAAPPDRSFRQSQFDAAARFCGKVFGGDYAEVLMRAKESGAAMERKAAAKA